MRCFLSVAFTAVVFSAQLTAQQTPGAVQVDVMGKSNCEDLLARTQNFYLQIKNNPGTLGLVVIHPDKDSIKSALFYKNGIRAIWAFWKFDSSKLKIVRGADTNRVEMEFWLLPPGAKEPMHLSTDWPNETINSNKPFVYGTSYTDEMCPTFLPELYANLVKSNPTAKGYVVIHPYNSGTKWALAAEWKKTLIETYLIPRTQIKILFAKPARDEFVEFWIVPIKKK